MYMYVCPVSSPAYLRHVWPNKPSVQSFLWCGNRDKNPCALMWPQAPTQTMPSRHALNLAWGEYCVYLTYFSSVPSWSWPSPHSQRSGWITVVVVAAIISSRWDQHKRECVQKIKSWLWNTLMRMCGWECNTVQISDISDMESTLKHCYSNRIIP